VIGTATVSVHVLLSDTGALSRQRHVALQCLLCLISLLVAGVLKVLAKSKI